MKNNKGFTLIEVIIVVVLIGVLTAIAIPSYLNWLPNYRLKGAARNLYSNMQKAKVLAVKMNRSTAVIFDTDHNRYDLCDDWDTVPTPSVCVGNLEQISLNSVGSGVNFGHANAATSIPGGVFPSDDVSYSSPDNVAVFNSRGFGNAGYVYLDHKDNTTAYAVGSLSSGAIRIRKWQGGTW